PDKSAIEAPLGNGAYGRLVRCDPVPHWRCPRLAFVGPFFPGFSFGDSVVALAPSRRRGAARALAVLGDGSARGRIWLCAHSARVGGGGGSGDLAGGHRRVATHGVGTRRIFRRAHQPARLHGESALSLCPLLSQTDPLAVRPVSRSAFAA